MDFYKWCWRCCCCYHYMNPFVKTHCCHCNSCSVSAEVNHKYCHVMWYSNMDWCNWMYCMSKQWRKMMDRPNSLADYSCTTIANCLAIVNQTVIVDGPRAVRFVNVIETTLLCLHTLTHAHTQWKNVNTQTSAQYLCSLWILATANEKMFLILFALM